MTELSASGLSASTVGAIRDVLARYPAVDQAVLYGSRAKGNFKTGSDIDLSLFGKSLTTEMLFSIGDALDELLLPYSIDLSIFADIDHAPLREHIERVGLIFYRRDEAFEQSPPNARSPIPPRD